MNLIDVIKNQLTPEMVGKLASTLGVSEGETTKAMSAAVPAFLAALAGLASSPAGAEKLVSTLRTPDVGSSGGLGDILGGGLSPADLEKKGGGILGSLLGSGGLAALVGAVAKFVGSHPEIAKKLLTVVGPFVLSTVLGQLKGRGLNAEALSSLFAENKASIAGALPSGFQMPSLSQFVDTAAKPVESGVPKWLLPAVVVAALAAGAFWLFSQGQPAAGPDDVAVPDAAAPTAAPTRAEPTVAVLSPDLAALSKTLTETYGSATQYLADVKDVPSAEAAVPRFQGLSAGLDTLKAGWDKLPDAAKASLKSIAIDNLGKLKDLVAKVLAIPGVAEKLKPTLDALVAKLSGLS